MRIFLILVLMVMTVTTCWAADTKEAGSLQQGKALFAAGNYKKAANAFAHAARLNPSSTEALHEEGMCYLMLGANDAMVNMELVQQAVTAFTKALDIDPNLAKTRYQLGVAYLVLHDQQEAMKQRDSLKNLDTSLAQALTDRIAEFKPDRKFRKVVTSGDRQRPVKSRQRSDAPPPATSQAMERFTGTVVMYGADWCPRCREANRYMRDKGISFVYHNIDQDAAARRDFEAYGGNGIPLIIIGSKKMRGFSAASLEYYLNYSR